jgi:hypothetical protein
MEKKLNSFLLENNEVCTMYMLVMPRHCFCCGFRRLAVERVNQREGRGATVHKAGSKIST